MTVSSTTNRNDYIGAGSLDTYAYSFKIFSESSLVVTVADTDDVETTLTIATDYTVTGVGEVNGGNIVFVDSGQDWLDGDGDLKIDYFLTIRRVRSLLQGTDIRNQGDYFPETHEDEFDKQIMIDQQQQEEIDRSLKVQITSNATVVLPTPVDGNVPVWDGTDGDMVNQPYSLDALDSATDDAQTAQTAAELAQTGAETAETNAETAETNAETAETNAEASEIAAAASAASIVVDDVTIEKTTDIHIKALGVDTAQLAADAVDDTKIANDVVKKEHINADVVNADNGLKQEANGSLSVDPSDTNPGLEISDGGLRSKVDDSTIERAAGGIQVKDAGITAAKHASGVITNLGAWASAVEGSSTQVSVDSLIFSTTNVSPPGLISPSSIKTDSSNPPTTVRSVYGDGGSDPGFMMSAVKAGDYYLITDAGGDFTSYIIPLA